MANVRLAWALPTTHTDASPITPTELVGTDVLLSADGGQNFVVLARVAAPANTFRQTELEPGTYVFRLIAVHANEARNSAAVDGVATIPSAARLSAIADLVVTIE